MPKSGDFEEIQNFVHNIFVDSYLKDEAATIEILNGTGVSGKAKKVSDLLLGFGYKVVNVGNSPTLSEKTVIYDHSSGTKPYTIGYLEKRFNTKAVKQKNTSDTTDITIIVGKDQL